MRKACLYASNKARLFFTIGWVEHLNLSAKLEWLLLSFPILPQHYGVGLSLYRKVVYDLFIATKWAFRSLKLPSMQSRFMCQISGTFNVSKTDIFSHNNNISGVLLTWYIHTSRGNKCQFWQIFVEAREEFPTYFIQSKTSGECSRVLR